MERTRFIGRLNARLRQIPEPETAEASRADDEAAKMTAAQRLELFAARLRELGVLVEATDAVDDAVASVVDLCRERNWDTIVCDPELRSHAFADLLIDEPEQAQFGLARATAGIARTGTVVVRSGPDTMRSCSLLPPATGFFLRAADVVDDLDDVLRALDNESAALPACVTFISGPSNTADIAGQLCTGVHGPGEVFVWILRD